MKSHEEIRSMLSAMAGGDLSKTDQELLEQHLAECQSCRNELSQLQVVVEAVRSTPELEPPPWLASRIMARVQEESDSRKSWFGRLFLPLQIKLPLEALALVMICVTTWYVMQDIERSQQRSQVDPSAQAPATTPAREATREPDVQAPGATVPVSSPPAATVAPKKLPPPAVPVRPEAQRAQAAPAFAPSPQVASDRIEQQMERSKSASESAPVTSAASREQLGGSPAPMAERKMAAKRKAESSDRYAGQPALQALRLRMVVEDRTVVPQQLKAVVRRLNGTVLESHSASALIRVQVVRLPELLDQVARIGRITERPAEDRSDGEWIELQVIW